LCSDLQLYFQCKPEKERLNDERMPGIYHAGGKPSLDIFLSKEVLLHLPGAGMKA